MARVGYLTTADAQGDAKELLGRMEQRGGGILNLYRALANSPNAMRNFMRLGNSLLVHGLLPPILRELAILRVAQISEVQYEWAHHVPIAKQAGVSDAQMATLASWPDAVHFDDAQRAVLRYAEAVASLTVTDEVSQQAREHLSEGELVELTLVVGYWGMVARLLAALDIDVEPEFARRLPS